MILCTSRSPPEKRDRLCSRNSTLAPELGILSLPLTVCVPLGNLLKFSEPQFFHL